MANPIASTTGVADSVLKMSVGAGTNAHTIVGIITARKMTAAQISKPNLQCLKIIIPVNFN